MDNHLYWEVDRSILSNYARGGCAVHAAAPLPTKEMKASMLAFY
ncbi:hypothetical protein HMPREF0281_00259 [Corynebacterium ammoniagenes DSM 20306]|uniref:Uncharacterized protein n=1 Tax=Corynebacterium ammoniagenes DSM 20306 TaxID=649754 RepID=A0ABN0AIH7_CORAM|nr:hypothetical protein HMPREF0281_00259 [Corynebacterium ammoniagenes DSM 20306]